MNSSEISKKKTTVIRINTFKIMPITLIPLPLPATFEFDTPTMQRAREMSAVIEVNSNRVVKLAVTSSIILTAMFKSVNKKPIAADVFDRFSLLTFLFTLSLFIL